MCILDRRTSWEREPAGAGAAYSAIKKACHRMGKPGWKTILSRAVDVGLAPAAHSHRDIYSKCTFRNDPSRNCWIRSSSSNLSFNKPSRWFADTEVWGTSFSRKWEIMPGGEEGEGRAGTQRGAKASRQSCQKYKSCWISHFHMKTWSCQWASSQWKTKIHITATTNTYQGLSMSPVIG